MGIRGGVSIATSSRYPGPSLAMFLRPQPTNFFTTVWGSDEEAMRFSEGSATTGRVEIDGNGSKLRFGRYQHRRL